MGRLIVAVASSSDRGRRSGRCGNNNRSGDGVEWLVEGSSGNDENGSIRGRESGQRRRKREEVIMMMKVQRAETNQNQEGIFE